jgi:hypothetical protein
MSQMHTAIAVFTHGPQGPGPRAANFQGRHIKKKSRLKYGMRKKKKGCPRERNLREIYTEKNVGTTARPSFLVTTLLALVD